MLPFDSNMKIIEDEIDYVDTWRAMEDLQKKGLVKSIGVCNFNRRQLERLLRYAQIAPVTNQVNTSTHKVIKSHYLLILVLQVECHPYLNQERLIEFCRSRGILITAYYPVCSPDRPWAGPDDPLLLDDLRLRQIAHKYKKTSAQVVLRYQVQRGNIVISRSLQKSAIEEDIGIFDFELLVEEMKYISTFECRGRSFTFLRFVRHFNIIDVIRVNQNLFYKTFESMVVIFFSRRSENKLQTIRITYLQLLSNYNVSMFYDLLLYITF